MWWDKIPRLTPQIYSNPVKPSPARTKWENPATDAVTRQPGADPHKPGQTYLGRSVVLHGELTGSEDLLIEARFEGNITLQENILTVGPEAQVKGEIRARHVVVHGSVESNISAREKIEIHKTGHVVGDLHAAAISIEEGAYFKGKIAIVRTEEEAAEKSGTAPSAVKSEARARKEIGVMRLDESHGFQR